MNGIRLRSGLLLVALLAAGCGSLGTGVVQPGAGSGTPANPPGTPGGQEQPQDKPVAADRALTSFPFEKFSKDKDGDLADPTNLAFVGTEGQILEAARKGGWLGADPVNAWTSLKMINAALRHKPYPTAPMSSLYLFGRVQDISLQIPTPDVAVRDHFRIWQTAFSDKLGRPVWAAAGTKDIAIKLEPGSSKTSHQIAPNIDEEREVIVATFLQSGLVDKTYRIPGIGHRFDGMNGSGDPYYTDGNVAVIEIKNFEANEPKKKKK